MRKSILILILLGFGIMTSCSETEDTPSDFLRLVPQKTAVILKSNHFSDFVTSLEETSLVSQNKNLPLFQFLREAFTPVQNLEVDSHSLLLFSSIGKDQATLTLITSHPTSLPDDLINHETDSFKYNGETITTYEFDEEASYSTSLNGIFVWGNSKLVIENIIRLSRENLDPDLKLQKLYETTSSQKPSLLIQLKEFQKLYQQHLLPNLAAGDLENTTDWIALDIDSKKAQFRFNGVTLPDRNTVLGIFKNTKPQRNEIQEVVPANANGFMSFTYDNFETLKDNLSFYNKTDYPSVTTSLYDTTKEIGIIYTPDKNKILVLNSFDTEETENILNSKMEEGKPFRAHPLYTFSEPDYFETTLQPLVNLPGLRHFTRIKHFYFFAQDPSALEYLIASYQNRKTLTNDEAYENTLKKLDEKSSLLLSGPTKNLSGLITEGVDKNNQKAYEELQFTNYRSAALQFITHDNYTYVNGALISTENAESSSGGSQIGSIKPGEEIANGPWTFENWQNQHHDIIFQGTSHTLYSYDATGKLNWKMELDGPILGTPETLDIYQNKRLQKAFVTPQTFYIIDRLGNVVKPYKKRFDDRITQPLAVFDYSNNGRFRFVIIQGHNVVMLDKSLNAVRGFEFNQAESDILQSPKHFRLGDKDYLLFPEKSGKLNILNPRGQTRIDVKEKIDFSDNTWFFYNNLFTSTSSKGELLQLGTDGTLQKKNLKLDSKNTMTATAKTLVTFSENKLTINDKTAKLNFGIYTDPRIFYINDKIYVTVTDLQDHNVYVFDSNAQPIKGFPVYGNSEASIQNIDNQGGLELLVKGEEDSILIYQINE